MRKRFFSILVYASFVFLLVYFYRQGKLDIRLFRFDPSFLFLSLALLCCGFVAMGLSWWNALKVHTYAIGAGKSLYSNGIQIFTKYIPGKIWTILGRASFATAGTGLFREYAVVSLKEQLVYIWTGLVISVIPLLFFYGNSKLLWLTLLLVLILTLLLFNRRLHGIGLGMLKRLSGKEASVPFLGFSGVGSIMIYCFLQWLLWMSGFYFFAASVDPGIPIAVAFTFPLGVTLGLLAVIFPGGIGVREGIITGFMVIVGVDPITAGTISVASRFWFVAGEVFTFFLALILQRSFR